jgi:hypothetical protein
LFWIILSNTLLFISFCSLIQQRRN